MPPVPSLPDTDYVIWAPQNGGCTPRLSLPDTDDVTLAPQNGRCTSAPSLPDNYDIISTIGHEGADAPANNQSHTCTPSNNSNPLITYRSPDELMQIAHKVILSGKLNSDPQGFKFHHKQSMEYFRFSLCF